jgi:hypothetical protein
VSVWRQPWARWVGHGAVCSICAAGIPLIGVVNWRPVGKHPCPGVVAVEVVPVLVLWVGAVFLLHVLEVDRAHAVRCLVC